MPLINGEALTLVKRQSGYSVYRNRFGEERLIAARTRVQVFRAADLSQIALNSMWFDCYDLAVIAAEHRVGGSKQPQVVDTENLTYCRNCGTLRGTPHPDGENICRPCIDNLPRCVECNDPVRGNCVYLGEGGVLCETHQDLSFYCEDCDGTYLATNMDNHLHGRCDCESPHQLFTVPGPDGPIGNDTRVHISLPAGMISEEGALELHKYLSGQTLDFPMDVDMPSMRRLASDMYNTMDRAWVTPRGNFPKRLSSLAYKTYGLRLPTAVLTQVGNIGAQHTAEVDFYIEVTRNLNLDAEAFANEGSCWWSSESYSRCALKSHGGFGLRCWDDPHGETYDVTGRVWVMPMRVDKVDITGIGRLSPTFDTMGPDCYIVFNGYGKLQGIAGARAMGLLAGKPYKSTNFYVEGMYVNGGGGYLVGDQDLLDKVTELRGFDFQMHTNLYEREQEEARTISVTAGTTSTTEGALSHV